MMGNLTNKLRKALDPWQEQDVGGSYDLFNEIRTRYMLAPAKRLSSTLSKPGEAQGNAKLDKTANRRQVAVGGRALMQANGSGVEVCNWRTPACTAACLGSEGNYLFPRNRLVLAARTMFEFEYPHHAWSIYEAEIHRDLAYARKRDWSLFWRPDILSDSQLWTIIPELFDRFPGVTFYGYTKNWTEALKYPGSWVLPNYRIAVSASEREDSIHDAVANGTNVAVVFDVDDPSELPTRHVGHQVVDATVDDAWMIENDGVIGGLVPIGFKMAQDTSGFVKEPEGNRNATPVRMVADSVSTVATGGC